VIQTHGVSRLPVRANCRRTSAGSVGPAPSVGDRFGTGASVSGAFQRIHPVDAVVRREVEPAQARAVTIGRR
jgi:hypothetical protein